MARKGEIKAKYWVGVLYPENMREDWQEQIGDIIELPYAYCIHNGDLDMQKEGRKAHIHLMIAFNNTTTEATAYKIYNKLSAEGKKASPGIQAVNNIRHTYNYLIHNTETSKKLGKHLYNPSERICGNNFDIGSYEQISMKEKEDMANELAELIDQQNITNFMVFYRYVKNNFGNEYVSIMRSYSSFYERLIAGNYHNLPKD